MGEVVREESPLGLIVVQGDAASAALALAVPGEVQADMLEAAARRARRGAGASTTRARCERLRLRLDGLPSLDAADLEGAGQTVATATSSRSRDCARRAAARRPRRRSTATCGPEPFIESDAPEILAEAEKAVGRRRRARARAPSGWCAT